MLNTIIHRIEQLTFDGRDSLKKLDVLSNVAIVFLKAKLKRPYPTVEMVECITEINPILQKDYSGKSGNEKFVAIKNEVLKALTKLKPTYYENPNNRISNSVNFIDSEKTMSIENERDIDFLIVEQNNIDYFKEQPPKTQFEEHGRLFEHYIGLGSEFFILKDSTLPAYIKNEFDSAFKKWKENFVKP